MTNSLASFVQMASLWQLSRPRFWPYLAGPYIIGVASTHSLSWSSNQWIWILIGLLFFLWPANFYVYTVNDIHDYETDKHNPKKQKYEQLLKPAEHPKYNLILSYILTFSLGGAILLLDIKTQAALFAFFFLAHFYSTPPIRAKSRPVLDMLFNALYVMPALVGFYLAGGGALNTQWSLVLAAILWCMAMHAYSAVPDIQSDKKAGVATIATLLGQNTTLTLCIALYIGSTMLTISTLGIFSILIGSVYVTLMLLSMMFPTHLFKFYSYFPIINFTLGFLLFILTVLH